MNESQSVVKFILFYAWIKQFPRNNFCGSMIITQMISSFAFYEPNSTFGCSGVSVIEPSPNLSQINPIIPILFLSNPVVTLGLSTNLRQLLQSSLLVSLPKCYMNLSYF
jgi:hypothetical protein